MDIHKPKAAHSWREFAVEIGTIICGILIALGLEQAIEALHWRDKIEQAQSAIRLELSEDDGPQAYARAIAAGCLDAQLDGLEQLAAQQPDRRVFRKAALAYSPVRRSWDSEAWQAVRGSDMGAHAGAEELSKWSGPYQVLPEMEQQSEQEARGRSALVGIPDRAGRLSDAELDRIAQALQALRDDNTRFGLLSTIMLQSIKLVNAEVSEADRNDILRQGREHYGACVHEPDFKRLRPSGALAGNGNVQFASEDDVRSWIGLPPRR